MPNWTSNDLKILGERRELARFKKQARYTRKDQSAEGKEVITECAFCFEGFLPMPEELKDMSKGCTTIKGVQYTNWRTINGVDVGIPAAELAALKKKYGASDWYERNCAVLGTKWDVEGYLSVDKADTNLLGYTFDSAWAPPAPGIQAISKQYPTCTFKLKFTQEEGGGGSYTIKNGKVIGETSWEGEVEDEEGA